jgi:hypothetical protein
VRDVGRARAPFPSSRLPLPRRLLADPLALRYWLAAGVLATCSGLLVHRSTDAARASEQAWGATRPVLVVSRPVAPGDRLREATSRERWPAHLVPSNARREVTRGDRAAVAIDPGSPLTDALVATRSVTPDDRRLLAVPLGPVALPLEEGDRVELWAANDPSFPGLASLPSDTGADGHRGNDRSRRSGDGSDPGDAPSDERSEPITSDALVVQVLDAAAVVAVPSGAVREVARALSAGPVTVVGLP